MTQANETHTPGPWNVKVIEDAGERSSTRWLVTARAIVLAETKPLPPRFTGAADANARLIAATPDLLAACADALGTITHHPDWKDEQSRWPVKQTIDKLRAAIAKAKGHAGEEGR